MACFGRYEFEGFLVRLFGLSAPFIIPAEMPGRDYKVDTEYRYGFNGQEKLDEIKGDGNSLDFGARIYDPRLGRFLSTDPLTKNYVSKSPYQYASNSPIRFIDIEGKGTGDLGIPFGITLSVFLSGNQFVTKNFIIEAAKAHGIEDPYNNLTRIGRVFEDAALRSLGLEDKKKKHISLC